MYRIRFHGRGGQGIKTASRILGSAFFSAGFDTQDAPRYGAERRGAPIFAYVRAAREPINERGIIRHPGLVVVADDSLIAVPAAGVLSGLKPDTVLLVNSRESAKSWRHRLNIHSPIINLPIDEIIEDSADLAFVGAACAGAAAGLVNEISTGSLEQAIEDELKTQDTDAITANQHHARTAFDLMRSQSVRAAPGADLTVTHYEAPNWVDFPFENAEISAPVIRTALSSVRVRTGLWRTMRPVIDQQRCKGCWWICSNFCPDAAISVTAHGLPEIDYDHCKGCLICVAQCPPHAIEAITEHEAQTGNVVDQHQSRGR